MEKTFLYHALASGVSGKITLPFQDVIAVQAPSALPFTGGYSSSRVEGFRYKDIFSFSSASTTTAGSENENSYDTLATAVVEGLNVLNVITADRVVARLASKYTKNTREFSATFAGTHFQNLRVAGKRLDIEFAPERLKSSARSEKLLYGSIIAPLNLKDHSPWEVDEDGGIYLAEYGRVHFAEAVVTSCYQSITMFRAELGCAVKGHVAVGHVSTDGEPFPP